MAGLSVQRFIINFSFSKLLAPVIYGIPFERELYSLGSKSRPESKSIISPNLHQHQFSGISNGISSSGISHGFEPANAVSFFDFLFPDFALAKSNPCDIFLRSSIILSKSCFPVSVSPSTSLINLPVIAAWRIAFLKLVSFFIFMLLIRYSSLKC